MIENQNLGKETATKFRRHESSYRISVNERGTVIEGFSSDSRYTGTCDRCGTAIRNVHVFSSTEIPGFMHVGIDCAQRMGVPLSELKSASSFIVRYEREKRTTAEREARALAREEFEANIKIFRAADLGRVEAIRSDVNASEFERDLANRIERLLLTSYDPVDFAFLESTEARLALCKTSRPVVANKPIRKLFTAYRKPAWYSTQFGDVCISFLCDNEGNAYIHKSSGARNVFRRGEEFEATFTIKGSDVRDGLTSTILQRPRDIVAYEPEDDCTEEGL